VPSATFLDDVSGDAPESTESGAADSTESAAPDSTKAALPATTPASSANDTSLKIGSLKGEKNE